MSQSVIGTIPPGGVGGGGSPPKVSTPFLPGCEKKWIQKGPSNRLKIEQQVAYGFVLIANQYGSARQNSYGYTAIWSWKLLSL